MCVSSLFCFIRSICFWCRGDWWAMGRLQDEDWRLISLDLLSCWIFIIALIKSAKNSIQAVWDPCSNTHRQSVPTSKTSYSLPQLGQSVEQSCRCRSFVYVFRNLDTSEITQFSPGWVRDCKCFRQVLRAA